MPKIRTVKPSFFMSRSVKRLTDEQKLVFLGLLPNADDEGRMLDEPEILAGQLWALSKSASKLDRILDALDDEGRITRYESAGERYIQVTNWHEHQKISRPVASLIPPVPNSVAAAHKQRRNSVEAVSQHSRKGKEGKGKEGEASFDAEPPLFCSSHLTSESKPPCGQCADARRSHEGWLRAQKSKPTAAPPTSAELAAKMCPVEGHGEYPLPCNLCERMEVEA